MRAAHGVVSRSAINTAPMPRTLTHCVLRWQRHRQLRDVHCMPTEHGTSAPFVGWHNPKPKPLERQLEPRGQPPGGTSMSVSVMGGTAGSQVRGAGGLGLGLGIGGRGLGDGGGLGGGRGDWGLAHVNWQNSGRYLSQLRRH
jgi:hypothetical protein